jgi:general secretion pathway protein C
MVQPDFSASPSTSLRPAFITPTRLSAEKLSELTGIKLPEPEVAIKEPISVKPVGDDLSSEPVHTSLHAKLQGETLSNDPLWSRAFIEDTQAHSFDNYMVDDRIQGARVLNITDDCGSLVKSLADSEEPKPCVLVLNAGHREYIDDKEGNGPVLSSIVAPPPVAVAPDNGNPVKAIGENEYDIPKSEVDKTLSNLNDVAMQARIVPAFKDGQATGFKLFSIRPDSIYSKLGIQNGDVIRRINGFDINSPDKALEAYSKLRDSSHIEIEVERNGSIVRKNYNVR